MRRLAILLFLISLASIAQAQIQPQITGAGAPTNPCYNGGQQYFDTTNRILYNCSVPGQNWVNIGIGNLTGGGGTTVGGTLNSAANFIASPAACGGASNCLQLTADDSTDNCGTALTTWIAAINAYSGTGAPYVTIFGGAKPYLFKTCNLAFTISGLVVNAYAAFDAGTNSSNNLIQFAGGGVYTWNGGIFNGGASLANAGFEATSGTGAGAVNIYNTSFYNFGAGNATLGTCTNWAIKIDSYIAQGNISYNNYYVSDSTTGRCAFTNGGGTSIPNGNGTVFFTNNLVGGRSGSFCGGIGIQDGGSYGAISGNNVGNMAVPINIQGSGHRVTLNQLDTEGCTPAVGATTNAVIQVGTVAGSTVPNVTIDGNQVQFGSGHATDFIAPFNAGGVLQDWVVVNNHQSITTSTTALIVPSGTGCTVARTTSDGGNGCLVAGNKDMVTPHALPGSGWQIGTNVASGALNTAGANIGSTTVFTEYNTTTSPRLLVNCQVIIITAATTSSTLPQCQVQYTEVNTAGSVTVLITPVWAANTPGCSGSTTNTVGNSCSGRAYINPSPNTTVNISTVNYASVGGTSLLARAYVDVENPYAQ